MYVKATVFLVGPIATVLLGVTEETVGNATNLVRVAHPSERDIFHSGVDFSLDVLLS